MKRYIKPLVALAIIAVIGIVFHFVTSVSNTGTYGAAPAAVTCTFGATGADVEVQITNDSTPCSQWETALAGDGESWYPISALTPAGSPGPADGETENLICTLNKGGAIITVDDAGMASYGTTICSASEQGGWS